MNPVDEIDPDAFNTDDICDECESIERCLAAQECLEDWSQDEEEGDDE